MSRVGKKSITIPSGVELTIENNKITVKGPRGTLEQGYNPALTVTREGDQLTVTRPNDQKLYRSLHGLTRSLIANMVRGVTAGFSKTLEVNGVGYRANVEGGNLVLQLGYSHAVNFPIPEDLQIAVEKQTVIKIEGKDKQRVGQAAANIRELRGPEPYKGKGIKYSDETIRRKAGKAGA